MIPYASRTGTRRNLAALREADWRLLVSARGVLRTEGFRYALDNGAWTAYQRGEPFDRDAFERALELLGADADWIVVPDVVMDARATLEAAEEWLPRLSGYPLLLAVQDGMDVADVAPLISSRVGIFLGGSTPWKLRTMRTWGEVARTRGAHFHVGRVNTARRIAMCQEAGAHSFDGSSASRYAKSLPRLDRAVRQGSIFAYVLPRLESLEERITRRGWELFRSIVQLAHEHDSRPILDALPADIDLSAFDARDVEIHERFMGYPDEPPDGSE